jgi:hypothetical protein
VSHIDDAMARFAVLDGSSVGRGPRHPTEPNPEPGLRIEQFLSAYPALRNDAGYVQFLEKYAGASIENEDGSQIVDILGFTEASTDIDEADGPVVDSDGFLMVAEAIYHVRDGNRTRETVQHAFAYDVTGDRPGGIYHSLVSTQQLQPSFAHAFDTFEAWLDDVIDREGWLDPPGHR